MILILTFIFSMHAKIGSPRRASKRFATHCVPAPVINSPFSLRHEQLWYCIFFFTVRDACNFTTPFHRPSGTHEEYMREHMRAEERVQVAKRQQEEPARGALSSVELVAKGSFGYT